MRDKSGPDIAIAAVAGRQGGMIARQQLLALGLSPAGIHRRVRSGRLHPVYAGVYAVGHRVIGLLGRQWAAVLACGEGAALSHWSAGAAWRMIAATLAAMHVSAARAGRGRAGLKVHRRTLARDEITTLDGLPITTPARTTIDLAAAGLRGRKLEAALDAAVENELDFSDLQRLLDRHRGRPGVPAVATLLERYTPGTIDTRSVLEDVVLDLCDAHGIPRPLVNAIVAGRLRDFYWPDVPLVVEADSNRWHRSPAALTADRRRDAELTLAGLPFLRFSYTQITEEPEYVAAATLAALTPRGRAAPRPARSAGGRRP
ncbi:MAG TPA: type IV toxin-antitoxin system AbiEi family antitoxin domain-containing protein [Solirubrobacteraceae bacterium]|nr:type IV toxin-antitoxin system AbiEi family antitoxin domain-containing protein [Solirubrobacteraceae bacterium]